MTTKTKKAASTKKDAYIHARISSEVKEEASAVLAAIGLSPSAAYVLLMTKIAEDKALPFSPLIPNKKTIEAMKAARRGELIPVASVDDLFADVDDEEDEEE